MKQRGKNNWSPIPTVFTVCLSRRSYWILSQLLTSDTRYDTNIRSQAVLIFCDPSQRGAILYFATRLNGALYCICFKNGLYGPLILSKIRTNILSRAVLIFCDPSQRGIILYFATRLNRSPYSICFQNGTDHLPLTCTYVVTLLHYGLQTFFAHGVFLLMPRIGNCTCNAIQLKHNDYYTCVLGLLSRHFVIDTFRKDLYTQIYQQYKVHPYYQFGQLFVMQCLHKI